MRFANVLTEKIPIMLADFLTGGFTGWVYETVITSIAFGRFEDRGVLPVPILPIYGFFALILAFLVKRETNIALLFILSSAGATIFELMGAYLTESLMGERLWDYGDWPLNFFDGRISVFSSLIFGGMCCFFVKLLHPLILKIQGRTPKAFPAVVYAITAVLAAICIIRAAA